jgi:cell surface protein SprA
VPLVQSRNPDALPGEDYKNELWRPENNVDFALDDFTNLKIERNEKGGPTTEVYEKVVTEIINGIAVERTYRIKGNPTLGYVRNVLIGVRNPVGDEFTQPYYGELWVNELRLVGLDEKGGVAGLARLDADLADFGNVGLSGAYSSIGWGALDQKLDDRAKESVTQVDFSTGLQLGKLLGPNSKLQLPFYYQYSETVRKPQYDALDLDLPLAEKLRSIQDPVKRDSVREQSQDLSSLKQISLTNVRKEASGGRNGGGKVMPWDISNFTASYSYSRSRLRNEVVEKDQVDQHLASLDYGFSLQPKPLQPFKNLSKSIWLKWLTDLNLNPIPNSFTFGTIMDRKFGERSYRFSDAIFKTWFDKRFTWARTYSVRWDLAKSLKLTFNAANASVIDEPNEYVNRATQELIDPRVRKDSIWNNILDGGRTKDYNQQFRATFNVPLKSIPLVDWITMNFSYDATYSWRAASINTDSLGNVISNGQNSQVSTDFDFTKLYNKSKYLAKINKPVGTSPSANRPTRAPAKPTQVDPTKPPVDSLNQGGKKQVDKPKDPKKTQEVSPPLKIALRMLMAIRKFKVNYGETSGTTIPGFTPQTGFLGMASGFGAPGLSFVSGIQPEINRRVDETDGDYLDHARTSNWITTNAFQNAPVLQFKTKALDSRLSIEPFNDFKIDVDFSRNLSSNFSVFYKTYNKHDTSIDSIGRRSAREIGSFTLSYLAIPTLFMDDSIQVNQLFDKFETNRAIISEQRGIGSTPHDIDGNEYDYGFGRKQQDILVPAFLSAYTNKDPKNFEFTDMFDWLPRPNWTVSYNGLSKLNMFKEIFSNVRISHGYKSSLTINSFESDLSYDDYDEVNHVNRGQQNEFNLDTINRNYYSQFLLPNIIIEESFAPLIGIDVKTKNDMNISFAYNKRRSLAMGFISYELAETRSTTYDIGFDWKLKDVRIGFLPGFNSASNKKKSSAANKPQGGGGTPKLGNDLNILFDLSFSDNITFNHLLDQDSGARPTRGSKDITISPAISYDINKNVALRFFVDYRRQQPYVSNSYLVVNTEGGVTVRIKLE